MSTIAEENAAARAQAGIRTVSHEELQRLTNASPTLARARATAKAVSRTSVDVYSNPPDGYALALDKQRQPAPTPPAGSPPDGYAIALDKQRTATQAASRASSVGDVYTNPPDGYELALDEQRKEK